MNWADFLHPDANYGKAKITFGMSWSKMDAAF